MIFFEMKIFETKVLRKDTSIKIYVQLGYFYFLQAVNHTLKGLHIIALGFNPGYRHNVNQSAELRYEITNTSKNLLQ